MGGGLLAFLVAVAVKKILPEKQIWIAGILAALAHSVGQLLVAALIGAVFVGIGTGICVRMGGAVCGDDALAMCIAHVTHMKIERAYLITDLTVLGLSLTYIPFRRIIYSLLTVILSGQIIGLIQRKKQ